MRIFGVCVRKRDCVSEREKECVSEREKECVSECMFEYISYHEIGSTPPACPPPSWSAVGAWRGGDCDNKLWRILKRERYSRYRMRVSSPSLFLFLSFSFFSLSLSLSRLFTDGKKDGKTAPPYKSHTVI